MAKKTVVHLIDDIDGTTAAETILFTVDGVDYEIDLSEQNAAQMRRAMNGWIEASRQSALRRAKLAARLPHVTTTVPAEAARARQWARDNGFTVGPRGRLRSEVLTAFRSASAAV